MKCARCFKESDDVQFLVCPSCRVELDKEIDQHVERSKPRCKDCGKRTTASERRRNRHWCDLCAPEHRKELAQQLNRKARKADPLDWVLDAQGMTKQKVARVRAWWSRHPDDLAALRGDHSRVRARGSNYGMPVGDWMVMVANQDGRCGICGDTPEPDVRKLVVDHDHIDGHVRGLLCHGCNVGLGFLRVDGVGSVQRLRDAITYIERQRPYAPPKPG